MNKKVIYYDGKIVVLDEKGEERPVVYSDNFEKILVQENVIEECENIIRCFEKETDKNNKNKLIEKLNALYPFLVTTLFPPIFLTLMNKGAGISNTEIVETILGPMTTNEFILWFSKFTVPVGSFISLHEYNGYIYKDKNINGCEVCLDFLKNYLIFQKEILENLKKDANASNPEIGFKVYNIDDNNDLNILYRYRDLFYDLGYNLRRNYIYFMTHGELPKKLDRTYREEEKKKAKEYLEEKGKVLRKERM